MNEYFYQLKKSYNLADHMMNRVAKAKPEDWCIIHEQTLILLNINDYESDPVLTKFITDFECENKLSIIKYEPWFNFNWHLDVARHCCINMVISGYDSILMFGNKNLARHFTNIKTVPYQLNRMFLLNTKKFHSAINFNNIRYLLSIGVPLKYNYEKVLEYVQTTNM